MSDILAYADRQSVTAGARIGFKISLIGADTFEAKVVQLLGPSIGEGIHFPKAREREIVTAISGSHKGTRQTIHPGSWIRLDESLELPADFTLCAFISPTLVKKRGRQVILGNLRDAHGLCLALEDGRLIAALGADGGLQEVRGTKLAKFRWYFVALSVSAAGEVRLVQVPVSGHSVEFSGVSSTTVRFGAIDRGASNAFAIAAACDASGHPHGHFNGKIERPRVLSLTLDDAACAALALQGPAHPPVRDAVADWDFSQDMSGDRIRDVSGHGHDARALQMPLRATAGVAWTPEDHDWRSAPQAFGAIHFHDTDMIDADWETRLTLDVPADWKSACYALNLRSADGGEWQVPFFVVPGGTSKRNDTALLLPTATYAAYANHLYRMTKPWHEGTQGRLITVDTTDLLILRYPEIGRSSYDTHADGSSVHYSGLRRPVVNFRAGGRPYKFTQDLLIVAWLERQGIGFDILTDTELDRDGAAALSGYRTVISGSHPEYWSVPMLDGLESWLRQGGRFMAIGGNSIWWTIALDPVLQGIAEVRRMIGGDYGQFGQGDWRYQFNGTKGGNWIASGRAGPLYIGVGNTLQGNDVCAGYRRTAASRDARVAFMFDGIEDEVLGDFGVLNGGAAGFEIDRVDYSLGTPPHTLVVASSFDHSTNFESDIAEKVYMRMLATADDAEPIRADMVFFETANGGAVFSVGSIAYCGALSWNGYDNNIARLTANVLSRFRDPEPFTPP